MFSKFVDKSTAPADVRRNAAILKWLVTERIHNAATNDRLLTTDGAYNILPRVSFDRFVAWTRDFIAEVIGDVPPNEALFGAFSGGASTSRNRTESEPSLKYLGTADVTSEAAELFLHELEWEFLPWTEDDRTSLRYVVGNELFTVPKKSEIDRVACKEPDINMFLQKGAGSVIRRCLKRFGIDLNDQSINRSLAREGSLTGRLATLDLASASDSVTESLVRVLLPEVWFSLLDTVRSRVTIIDGEEHRCEMFSSMGNGFTFELESLLFFALAKATAYFRGVRGVISVYGDDIICPAELFDDLTWVLNYFGFQVNTEKSFGSGPFRESCGGHYWDGFDITPFYVKAPIDTLPALIHFLNGLRRWASIDGVGVCNPFAEELWLKLRKFVPHDLWGGGDMDSKQQLVSYSCASKRLVNVTRKRGHVDGSYYHWLMTASKRPEVDPYRLRSTHQWLAAIRAGKGDPDGIVTSRRVDVLDEYRMRDVRSPTVPRLPALFLSELG